MQNIEQKLSKLTEGLKEIFTIVEQQVAVNNVDSGKNDDDAVSSSAESIDSIIHTIISKIFKLSHAN